MEDIATIYELAPEVTVLVTKGVLVLEKQEDGVVEFDIPILDENGRGDRYKWFTLVWIKPSRNAELCHYYDTTPGDLPNFYVRIDTHNGEEAQPDLETVDDLVAWLQQETEE